MKIRFVEQDTSRRVAPAPYADPVRDARRDRHRAAQDRATAERLFRTLGEVRPLPEEAPVDVNGTPWWKDES